MWKVFSLLVFFIISIRDAYDISHYSYEYNEGRDCFIEKIDKFVKQDERPYISLYESLDGSGRNVTASDNEIPSLADFLQGRKFVDAKLLCLNSLWLVYPNERYNEAASGSIWVVTGFHCFNLEKSKIGSIQRFAEHPQWLPEEITFFQQPLFQGRMRKFGKHDGFVYHKYEENEATCGIYKSAIITGSTSWLIPLRKAEESKSSPPTRYCFSPSPSVDLEEFFASRKNCSSKGINNLAEGEIFRYCGPRPPPDFSKDSGESASSSDHNSSYYNDGSNEVFFAFPNFPNSIFKDYFPFEQDMEQMDYSNMIPYEFDESSSSRAGVTKKSKGNLGVGANLLSLEKVEAIESPVITIHDKPDLRKLFICILEDMALVSAPKGMAWDDDGDGTKECESERCNNLFMHTQLNITNCFRYGLAFQIQNMHSRKPNFCSDGGEKALNNMKSMYNPSDSQKGHGTSSDEKTSPLLSLTHAARDRKSFTKMLRLLQQKIEFDVHQSLTGSDKNRVHAQLKSQFTTETEESLRQSLAAEVEEDADIDERKQNDSNSSKESINVWKQSLLDVMFDILKKKCDQRWLPRDFLKLLNKLSLFFVQEGEMRIRGRKDRITREHMQANMNIKSSANNFTGSSINDARESQQKIERTNNLEEKVEATTGRPSLTMPFGNEIETMLQDCLHEVASDEPLTLIATLDEPKIAKYYRRSWKSGEQQYNYDSSGRNPLLNYNTTVDEMLSQQLDPVLEFLWQTYSLVYASCISNNSFNTQLLIFAKFSTRFEKFFLSPVVSFWKTMDSDLLSQYKDSIYNHLFSGYNYTLMVHNVKACAQAVHMQENVEILPKPTGIF